MKQDKFLVDSPLGKSTVYHDQYKPELLFVIARDNNRANVGVDIWNGYEFSWLDDRGQAHAKRIQLVIPGNTPNLIESKSLKLYLYSFANTKFSSEQKVIDTISADLSKAAGGTKVQVSLHALDKHNFVHAGFDGILIDDLPVTCTDYEVNAKYLGHDSQASNCSETLWSNLLKSNCPVTGHPDWASVRISYTGKKIDRAGLLKYIVSFREHQEFHEHCVEQIFCDVMHYCQPSSLLVEACYTRRGGLDINPVRYTSVDEHTNIRLYRQ